MRIPTAERARVPWQCVVSQGLAGPKGGVNLPVRRGSRLIFRRRERRVWLVYTNHRLFLLTLRDRRSRVIALSNHRSPGSAVMARPG